MGLQGLIPVSLESVNRKEPMTTSAPYPEDAHPHKLTVNTALGEGRYTREKWDTGYSQMG